MLTGMLILSGRALAQDSVESSDVIDIGTKYSIFHLGSLDSFDRTEGGTAAAKLMLQCLEDHDYPRLRVVSEAYERLIPDENFGGEYTALQWFCDCLTSSDTKREKMLADKLTREIYEFFAKDDFAALREYLKRKYRLVQIDEDLRKGQRRERFLEDFILFNNPRREQWEKSSKIIDAVKLKPGERVLDLGCGPGYFTFKFAELVGPTGKVFAVDSNHDHTDYVEQLVKKFGTTNVVPSRVQPGTLSIEGKVDVVFLCSLWHVIYVSLSENERNAFLKDIKDVMNPNARLIIVDNALVEDSTLPYHGPYIAKELIVSQLKYYGFRLVHSEQIIPQRYALVFEFDPHPAKAQPTTVAMVGHDKMRIQSEKSIINFRTFVSSELTQEGRQVAAKLYAALETRDRATIESALADCKALIPKVDVGEEYTAFQWICEYLLASEDDRKKMLSDRWFAEYFRVLSQNNFEYLKKYLRIRHRLDKDLSTLPDPGDDGDAPFDLTIDEMVFWKDYIHFHNPRREEWEKTSKMIEWLKLKPGDTVADIGCGPGYFSFEFADRVGSKGQVFAVEINNDHLKYVDEVAKRWGVSNVQTVPSRLNDARLPAQSSDLIFLCSLYHVVYATSIEFVKDEFIDSLKRALKPKGRLVIVDNAVVDSGEASYFGRYIAKELVISQLEHYGFRLVDSAQFVPQRYCLAFELK